MDFRYWRGNYWTENQHSDLSRTAIWLLFCGKSFVYFNCNGGSLVVKIPILPGCPQTLSHLLPLGSSLTVSPTPLQRRICSVLGYMAQHSWTAFFNLPARLLLALAINTWKLLDAGKLWTFSNRLALVACLGEFPSCYLLIQENEEKDRWLQPQTACPTHAHW